MRARTDSDTQDDIHDGPQAETTGTTGRTEAADAAEPADTDDDADDDTDEEHGTEDARRARWTAIGTGALLTLAGLAASLLRLTGSAPAFVPAAYALGAAVCALAALLGSRGRTRRALWLLIAGVMVMAIGDQAD
ncbi:hypothetical protein G9272_31340 [Streptomyces asoensis]|uniref:Uncharacterized protein n=1 Tax=Streptomyces asoensis TaxID=249586 RepID=A0A6M4WUM7_9ACTN|nr:hypothetical protein [Streptomyces asoensis]QJT04224.1 hypothetical protein G9272_31340 [Streptomyces asoensis]